VLLNGIAVDAREEYTITTSRPLDIITSTTPFSRWFPGRWFATGKSLGSLVETNEQSEEQKGTVANRKKRIAGMKEWLNALPSNTGKLWTSATFKRRQDAGEWLEGVLRALSSSTQRTPVIHDNEDFTYYGQETRQTRFPRFHQPTTSIRTKLNFNRIRIKPQSGQTTGRQASFAPVNMNVFSLEKPITFRPATSSNSLREGHLTTTTFRPTTNLVVPTAPLRPAQAISSLIPYIVPVNNIEDSDPDGLSYLPRPADEPSIYDDEFADYDLVETTPAAPPVTTTSKNVIRVDVYLKYLPYPS
jgi:hypothetical protein